VQAKLALEAAVTYYAAGTGVVPFHGYDDVWLPTAVADCMSSGGDDFSKLEITDGDGAEMRRVPALFLKRLHNSFLHQLREDDEEGRHCRVIVDGPVVLNAYGKAFACLEHIHSLGVVHNDLAERNLLTDRPIGEPNCRVYLADFGQALHASGRYPRLVDPCALTDPESVLSLEHGMCGARGADMYALALVTWSALSGVDLTMLEDLDQKTHLLVQALARQKCHRFKLSDNEEHRMAHELPAVELTSTSSLLDLARVLKAAAALRRRDRGSAADCAAALLTAAHDPSSASLRFPGDEWTTAEDDVTAQVDGGMCVQLCYQDNVLSRDQQTREYDYTRPALTATTLQRLLLGSRHVPIKPMRYCHAWWRASLQYRVAAVYVGQPRRGIGLRPEEQKSVHEGRVQKLSSHRAACFA
jgi:serine/threonine protein kinase